MFRISKYSTRRFLVYSTLRFSFARHGCSFRISKRLLHYIKLIEVLSYIKTEILSAIRDVSAELVVEGILSKKQMKMYFSSLPCSSSTALPTAAMDLKDYTLITLVKLFNGDKDNESSSYLPVNAQDINSALREMLP